jgi:hypothetical protein
MGAQQEMTTGRQWFSEYTRVAMDTHATLDEKLDVVFSVSSTQVSQQGPSGKLISHGSEVTGSLELHCLMPLLSKD